MTNSSRLIRTPNHEVLLAYGRDDEGAVSLGRADEAFLPCGFGVCRTHSGPATIRRIEQGGLAGAVLCTDERDIDGLSLIRIIRSIDVHLPCWLVTRRATRQTLEAALSLKVRSVMTHPVEVGMLVLALRKVLVQQDSQS